MSKTRGAVSMLVVAGCLLLVSSGAFAASDRGNNGTTRVDGAIWGGKGGGGPEGAIWGGKGGGGPEGAIWGGKGGGGPEGATVHVAGNPGQGYLHGLADFLRFVLDGAVWGGGTPPPVR